MIYVILYMMLYNTLYNVISTRCIQKISVFKKLANRRKSGILLWLKNSLDLNITNNNYEGCDIRKSLINDRPSKHQSPGLRLDGICCWYEFRYMLCFHRTRQWRKEEPGQTDSSEVYRVLQAEQHRHLAYKRVVKIG